MTSSFNVLDNEVRYWKCAYCGSLHGFVCASGLFANLSPLYSDDECVCVCVYVVISHSIRLYLNAPWWWWLKFFNLVWPMIVGRAVFVIIASYNDRKCASMSTPTITIPDNIMHMSLSWRIKHFYFQRWCDLYIRSQHNKNTTLTFTY